MSALNNLANTAWTGKSSSGWGRIKQYTNGTLYLEASDDSVMATLTRLIDGGSAAPSKTKSSSSSTSEVRGKLDLTGAYIGTDESGKGDYFGPLVIAGVYVTEKTMPILENPWRRRQ